MSTLPSHWKSIRLKDCCSRPEYGYTASASAEPIGPRFLRITDIQDGRVNWEVVPYVALPHKLDSSVYLQPGDMVVARIGATTGKAFLIRHCPEAIFASYLIRVRAEQLMLPEFLHLCFQTEHYWRQINQKKGGRLKGGVNIPVLENLELPLPPLVEQESIAKTLQAVQDARDVRVRQLILERERKAALVAHLLGHGTQAESRKDTDIGQIPASWDVVKLGDVVSVKGGKRLPKGSAFASGYTHFPYIRVVDLRNGSVKADDLKYLTPKIQQSIRRYTISKNDVYISIAGTIGLVGTIPDELDGANLTENAAKLVIHHGSDIDSQFLAAALNSEAGQRQIQNLTAKTTQPKLALTRIEQILVPRPPGHEQQNIAMVAQACDAKQHILKKRIRHLQELFRALLEGLMMGRIPATSLVRERLVQ